MNSEPHMVVPPRIKRFLLPLDSIAYIAKKLAQALERPRIAAAQNGLDGSEFPDSIPSFIMSLGAKNKTPLMAVISTHK